MNRGATRQGFKIQMFESSFPIDKLLNRFIGKVHDMFMYIFGSFTCRLEW